ncbi:MAG: glycerophosphodiester phosphodiesterase family protein [Candidatus Gorgyraea atricola]|nr:glycerophosphodiester phosphodiesterase family protein [Candidatus Gorgyraea atricola]
MKILKILFLLHAHLYFCFISQVAFANDSIDTALEFPEFVAHGGGIVYGIAGSNSLEALNHNYKKGFMFFELDFEWTTDEEMVLIHDWDFFVNELFSVEEKRYSLEEFRKFKMVKDLTQLPIDDLIIWMTSHSDAYVVTDIKKDNIRGLEEIFSDYPAVRDNFIPQIYSFEEYQKVKDIGFKHIILTLYASDYSNEEVIDFLTSNKVSALTMRDNKATKRFIKELDELDIFTFVHTVNDIDLKNELAELGVDGFYTDSLSP